MVAALFTIAGPEVARCRYPATAFDFAALIFEGETIEWQDDRRAYGEARVRAIGAADGIVLHVVFTERGEVRRIISARPASRRGRRVWLTNR